MSSNQRDARFWLSAWLPVVLGVAVIMVESTEFMGADHTSAPLRRFFEALLGHHMSNAHWDVVHHYIRKSGHFLGYGFIGLAWLRAWWMSLPNTRFVADMFLALMGTAFIASADEFHQSFLWNRTASPWDVLLDCSGAIALQLMAYIFMRIARPKRLQRAA